MLPPILPFWYEFSVPWISTAPLRTMLTSELACLGTRRLTVLPAASLNVEKEL